MSRIIYFLNFVSIIIISNVTGTFMVQSQCFFVLLNSDFYCDLSNIINVYKIGSNQDIRKIQKVIPRLFLRWSDLKMTLKLTLN